MSALRPSRRQMLSAMLLGSGGIALRSLATGLSTAFLAEGIASAEAPKPATFLLLATNASGDPLNVSAPGSLVDPGLRAAWDATHAAELASAEVALGGTRHMAARPWSTLPEALRARLGVVHHRTFAQTHTEHEKVMRVFGALRGAAGNGSEMLPSAIAAEIAATLGTVQREPVALAEERITFESRFVEELSPVEMKALFAGGASPLDAFGKLRDDTIDAVYAELKTGGTKAQREYLDRVVKSRAQAARLGEQLAVDLADVPVSLARAGELVPGLDAGDYDTDAIDQVLTAVALLKYGVTPVVTIHVPFGGDNHADVGFEQESLETAGGVRMLELVWNQLALAGLTDKTTFAMLNTFGRTFLSRDGRAHNGDHHAMVLFGPKVKGGVAGGTTRTEKDVGASAFDAATGTASSSGDVSTEQSFAAAARTLMRAVGVPDDRIEARLPGATYAKNLVG